MEIAKSLEEISRTIKKYKLAKENDKIYVGLSGGKDSAVAAYSLSRYVKNINAEVKGFFIKFADFQKNIERVIKKQAEMFDIDLKIYDLRKEIDLFEIDKRSGRPVCSACGTIRRQLMNKLPREEGATKVATGHHGDDFIVFFLKNISGGNFFYSSKFTPLLKSNHKKVLTKIRPLFFSSEEETEKICKNLAIPLHQEDICPFISVKKKLDKNREKLYKIPKQMEKMKGFKKQFLNGIIRLSKKLDEEKELKICRICGEPTNQEICGVCNLKRKMEEKNNNLPVDYDSKNR